MQSFDKIPLGGFEKDVITVKIGWLPAAIFVDGPEPYSGGRN